MSLLVNRTLGTGALMVMGLAPNVHAAPGFNCPAGCKPGFVWRNATNEDRVCVAPSIRAQIRADNKLAAGRRTYAPRPRADLSPPSYKIPCKAGYEWRQAVPDDYVCVSVSALDRDIMNKVNEASARGCSSAVCQEWTMPPQQNLVITQSNGYTVYLSFSHDAFVNPEGRQPFITGNAHYSDRGNAVSGFAQGSLTRDHFSVTVQWENATRGHYWGDITPRGDVIKGVTSDNSNRDAPQASWHFSNGVLSCRRFG
jgi:hypothetical protein